MSSTRDIIAAAKVVVERMTNDRAKILAAIADLDCAEDIAAVFDAFGPLLAVLEAVLHGRVPHKFDDQGGGSCIRCVLGHRYGKSSPMDDPIHALAVQEAVAALAEGGE